MKVYQVQQNMGWAWVCPDSSVYVNKKSAQQWVRRVLKKYPNILPDDLRIRERELVGRNIEVWQPMPLL